MVGTCNININLPSVINQVILHSRYGGINVLNFKGVN